MASGRLDLPEELVQRLEKKAKTDGLSMTQLLDHLLTNGTEFENTLRQVVTEHRATLLSLAERARCVS